jgi:hypothetical protein
MIPVPIEQNDLWKGSKAVVISPPDGDLTNDEIRAVEAVVDQPDSFDGAWRYSMKLELEEGDIEKLLDGGHVWLSMWGHVVPFAVDVKGPGE